MNADPRSVKQAGLSPDAVGMRGSVQYKASGEVRETKGAQLRKYAREARGVCVCLCTCMETHCKVDCVTYTFLRSEGLEHSQLLAELHVIKTKTCTREREKDLPQNRL